MTLTELKNVGWKFALCTSCPHCQGSGSVARSTFNTAHVALGPLGFNAATAAEVPCGRCINGFMFVSMPLEDMMTMFAEEFITQLEDPKNSALRKRYLDLYITDTEQRMTGKAP